MQGVSATTKKILTYGKTEDPFVETDDQVVARVLRDLSARGKGEIVVLNDEAHHCYRDRPLEEADDDLAEADRIPTLIFDEIDKCSCLNFSVGPKEIDFLVMMHLKSCGSGSASAFSSNDFSMLSRILCQ